MKAVILSYALDTNGSNARFVFASRKFGNSKAVIKALAIGNQDPAGVVTRFQQAATKGDALTIRSAHRSTAYFDFPTDIVWTRKSEPEILSLAKQADVIHLNNSEMPAKRFHLRKPMLLHHHGSLFRNNPERMLTVAKQWRMVQAVSTIDLTRPAPNVLHWLPSPYDLDDLEDFAATRRVLREPDGRIRIVHCPTNRELKHTALFLQAVTELQAEGLPIDVVLVEGKTWKESMEAKAQADILYDQLAYGYGCNSIEAWAMGIPVISGADEWTLGQMARQWPAIPFEEANEATLKSVIRAMVKSSDLRDDARERGLNHVRKYHAEQKALEKLAELYALAITTYDPVRIPGKGAVARFHSQSRRNLSYDGEPITFVNGEYETADPFIATHLRTLAKRRNYGITEDVA